jgi:hypothetical protein
MRQFAFATQPFRVAAIGLNRYRGRAPILRALVAEIQMVSR